MKLGKDKCKVIGCNNYVMNGDFGNPNMRYGYCQIHKIEGLVEEITAMQPNRTSSVIK